jgi:hypothetical protein
MAGLFGIEDRSPVYIREQAATNRETGAHVLTVRTVAVKPVMHIEPEPDPAGDRAELIAALEAHCGPLTTRIRFRYIATPPAEMAADLGLEPGVAVVEFRHLTLRPRPAVAHGRDRANRRRSRRVGNRNLSPRYTLPSPRARAAWVVFAIPHQGGALRAPRRIGPRFGRQRGACGASRRSPRTATRPARHPASTSPQGNAEPYASDRGATAPREIRFQPASHGGRFM